MKNYSAEETRIQKMYFITILAISLTMIVTIGLTIANIVNEII